MIRSYLGLLCTYVFFTSCQVQPYYIQLAHQEISAFSKEVKKENNLKLIGSGGGFLDRINSFSLTFSGNQKLDIKASRRLFIDISQRFITRINQNQEIRGYLSEYPFTIKNLELIILLPDYPESEFPKYVTSVGTTNSFNVDNESATVLYTAMDLCIDKTVVLLRETYEQALERVSQE